MYFLDHQFGQVLQHVGQILRLRQFPGRHVRQDRFFAAVEADHFRDMDVDRLVVGDARADGVGQGHVAGPVGVEQARHAEHGILAEGARIEKVVVDAAVDHVHPARSLRGAHVDRIVAHEEVVAVHQFDAHLLGEEGVLEIGAIELARRQHHHVRIAYALLRDRAQVVQQQVGVVLDRGDRLAGEEFGEEPHHHLAVFQHVGHAGRGAQVVFEYVVLALTRAHQVDAGDVGVDVLGYRDADHFLAELRIAQHLRGGDAPGLEDFLVVVDVVEEGVERLDPLPKALGHARPFVGRDDARHDVEGDQAFLAGVLAIYGEGDADAMEGYVGLFALARDDLGRGCLQPVRVAAVAVAHRAVSGMHFVVGDLHCRSCASGVYPPPVLSTNQA
jgi:hypothetical protein